MVSENQRRTYSAFQQTAPTPEDRQWFFVERTDSGLVRIRDAVGNIREAFLEGNRAITEGEPVLFIPPRPGQSLGVVQIEQAEVPPAPSGEMQQYIGAIQYLDGKDDPQPGQQRGTGDIARVKYTDPETEQEVDKGLFHFDGEKWNGMTGTFVVGYITIMTPANDVEYPLISPALAPLTIQDIQTRFTSGSATVSFNRLDVEPKTGLVVGDTIPVGSRIVAVFSGASNPRGFSASFKFEPGIEANE